jgi:hypothetical protein
VLTVVLIDDRMFLSAGKTQYVVAKEAFQ